MAEQYPIVGVNPPREWMGQRGRMFSYDVMLGGEAETVELTQVPSTPAPQVGQNLFGEIWLDNAGRRKFSKKQPGQGAAQTALNGSSAASSGDEMSKADWDRKDARIMWESLIRSAASMATAGIEKGEFTFAEAIDRVTYTAKVWAATVKVESRHGTGDPQPDFKEPDVIPQPAVEHVPQPGVAVTVPADEPLTTPFD